MYVCSMKLLLLSLLLNIEFSYLSYHSHSVFPSQTNEMHSAIVFVLCIIIIIIINFTVYSLITKNYNKSLKKSPVFPIFDDGKLCFCSLNLFCFSLYLMSSNSSKYLIFQNFTSLLSHVDAMYSPL